MKCLGRVAQNVSSFLETSEVKNESSEALLMSHMKSCMFLLSEISTSKVDFSMEKCERQEIFRSGEIGSPKSCNRRSWVGKLPGFGKIF